MSAPVVMHDGVWQTRLIPTRSVRDPWQWIVTNQVTKEQASGRASTEAWARHEARKALNEMRGETEAA